MIEEKDKKKTAADLGLERIAEAFRLATQRTEEMVDAGVKASKKVYFIGRLEVY